MPCPAGRYGASYGLTDAACTAVCPLGHYCVAGSAAPVPCPAGTLLRLLLLPCTVLTLCLYYRGVWQHHGSEGRLLQRRLLAGRLQPHRPALRRGPLLPGGVCGRHAGPVRWARYFMPGCHPVPTLLDFSHLGISLIAVTQTCTARGAPRRRSEWRRDTTRSVVAATLSATAWTAATGPSLTRQRRTRPASRRPSAKSKHLYALHIAFWS